MPGRSDRQQLIALELVLILTALSPVQSQRTGPRRDCDFSRFEVAFPFPRITGFQFLAQKLAGVEYITALLPVLVLLAREHRLQL